MAGCSVGFSAGLAGAAVAAGFAAGFSAGLAGAAVAAGFSVGFSGAAVGLGGAAGAQAMAENASMNATSKVGHKPLIGFPPQHFIHDGEANAPGSPGP